MDYQKDLSEALREQENLDREFEAQEKQRAFENAMKKESLSLEKAQTASAETKESGIEPEKDAYEYVDDIIAQNTKYNKQKGYKVIDRTAILKAISAIVKDTSLSYRYRYEMYLYGKSLGYIKE